jgi:hypothetical protein
MILLPGRSSPLHPGRNQGRDMESSSRQWRSVERKLLQLLDPSLASTLPALVRKLSAMVIPMLMR